MGKPNTYVLSFDEYIVKRSKPREFKHLSKRRKRNQNEIPLVAASEKGSAQSLKTIKDFKK